MSRETKEGCEADKPDDGMWRWEIKTDKEKIWERGRGIETLLLRAGF